MKQCIYILDEVISNCFAREQRAEALRYCGMKTTQVQISNFSGEVKNIPLFLP